MHPRRTPRNTYTDRPPHNDTLQTLEALLDRGVVVDGLRRVSVLGLELLTLDGPTRLTRAEPDRNDESA